ncbi:MAG: GGDEF domain-containing protein, partial [Sphingomonadaceae bacterium]|nr:GGDEF domain-containing protein [Sphingomonadaceae bacterium]
MKLRRRRTPVALRGLFPPAPALLEIELISMLFAGTSAIVLMGAAAALIMVQAVLADQLLSAAFCFAILVISIQRFATVRRFQRAGPPSSLREARKWEQRFAYGSYAGAFALGVSNYAALQLGDAVLGILIIGILFAYAFLVVLRVSVRPRICAISILLAVVPSAAAIPALFDSGAILSRGFAASALVTIFLILLAAAAAMLVHSYRLTLGQMMARRDLTHMARQDPLTGLLNRLALREHFDTCATSLSDGPLLAVHYLDLDRFKAVNDLNGHRCGDLLLVQVAQRLSQCMARTDELFRLGGDEFVILQAGLADRTAATLLAPRIIAAIGAA